MRAIALSEDQQREFLWADAATRERVKSVTIAGQAWTVDYDKGGGSVSAYLLPEFREAKLAFYWDSKAGRNKATAQVSYGGAYENFSDTTEIKEPGLRGLAETMLTILYEASRLVAEGRAAQAAAKEAARQAALDHIAKSL